MDLTRLLPICQLDHIKKIRNKIKSRMSSPRAVKLWNIKNKKHDDHKKVKVQIFTYSGTYF